MLSIYFAEPEIQNCTIAENYVTDVNSNGGGLFASYAADVIVKDTIFWANSGIDGSQIALSGGVSDMPAELTITYSDIDLRVGIDFNSLEFEDSGSDSGTTSVLVDSQTIYNEINSSGSAKVIVSLAEPTEMRAITNWNSPASVSATAVRNRSTSESGAFQRLTQVNSRCGINLQTQRHSAARLHRQA